MFIEIDKYQMASNQLQVIKNSALVLVLTAIVSSQSKLLISNEDKVYIPAVLTKTMRLDFPKFILLFSLDEIWLRTVDLKKKKSHTVFSSSSNDQLNYFNRQNKVVIVRLEILMKLVKGFSF